MDSHRNELINLIENNLVTDENLDEAVTLANIIPNSSRWLTFLNQLFLWTGSIALGLSMLFFIAFNWLEFGRFAKFALVEVSLAGAIISYLILKKESLLAKASITVAAIFVGVLLALFGQTYQTGADPWQLFFIWACLILPWTMTARFSVLWLISVILINVAFILYIDAHNRLFFLRYVQDVILWGLFAINFVSLIVWQLASVKCKWLDDGFSMRFITVTVAILITILAIISVSEGNMLSNLAVPMWAICMGLGYWLYRRRSVELFILAIGCLSGIMLIATLFINLLFNGSEIISAFLLLALIIVGLGACSAWWLNSVQKSTKVKSFEPVRAEQEPLQEHVNKEVQHESE
jgi:uncharacterized membrane protein